MRNQRGQATILIGIIFQMVFIFFAMVINVGLLVNDKINLQNSVDIAAYYGAMKQAEILNTMAHVNFQIRQAWKLLNWRLWVLADIGRNQKYEDYIKGFYSATDDPASWITDDGSNYPVVCVRNAMWWDENHAGYTVNQIPENFCKKLTFTIPDLKPFHMGAAQSSFLFAPFFNVFHNQSIKNSAVFGKDCDKGGPANYYFAALIASSYKIAVAHRRNAMRDLQSLLISGNDFRDISGHSVKDTVETVFRKNLTLANKDSIQGIEFVNSLAGQPFVVPIDVRLLMKYTDIWRSGGCHGMVRDLAEAPTPTATIGAFTNQITGIVNAATQTDYAPSKPMSAAIFAGEDPKQVFDRLPSLVGFEKNPWVMAYVKVRATTRPKMLFSPSGSNVELVAEAYAMPFGGRMGPWYHDTWPAGQDTSTGSSGNKVDSLLPFRTNEASPKTWADPGAEPNYSRFPGDTLGMKSSMSRVMGLRMLSLGREDLPQIQNDDYGNILADVSSSNNNQDPMVRSSKGFIRRAETVGIAPDLFDASYFSAQDHFRADLNKYAGSFFSTQICPFGCEDMGVPFPSQVEEQVTTTATDKGASYWKIKKVEHLNTGWSQEASDHYLPPGGGPSVLIGAAQPLGGRVGYSVKIVSEKFLRDSLQLGGPGTGPGKIKNPPP